MKEKTLKKVYKGLGFVEALIALSVSGVVAVVLMGISAEAISELRRLDMQDNIAQHAVSTAVILQDIAIKQAFLNEEDENIFYEYLNMGQCYGFLTDVDTGEVTIDTTTSYQETDRDVYSSSSVILGEDDDNPEFFRIMCVEQAPSASDMSKMLVKIITGSNRVEGKVTNNRDVKDYEYYSIIVL